MNQTIASCFLIGATLMLPVWGVSAQDSSPTGIATFFAQSGAARETLWHANANFIYDAEGKVRFQGQSFGDSDAYNINLEAGTRIALNEKWSLPLGVKSDNYYLGQIPGVPVTANIHTLRLTGGLSYRVNDDWTITGTLSPSLYRFSHIEDNTIGIAGGILGTYRINPTLNLTLGLFVSPDSEIPVMPAVGVRWMLDDKLTLEAGVPRTRLTYRLCPDWSVYTGADFSGTTFRTGPTLGTKIGQSQYNNALATYQDIRLGVGLGYQLPGGLRAEMEIGYSVYRDIAVKRSGDSARFDPAPYARLGLGLRF